MRPTPIAPTLTRPLVRDQVFPTEFLTRPQLLTRV
jgi:hypothetical protein